MNDLNKRYEINKRFIYFIPSIFFLIIFSSISFSAIIYDSEEDFFNAAKSYLVKEQSKSSVGDLNNDGLEDLVILQVTKQKNNIGNYDYFQELFILTQDRKLQFILTEDSERVICGKSCDLISDIKINKGSLFLTIIQNYVCSQQISNLQFKLYKKEWRLIGKKSSVATLVCSENGTSYSESDINLLTGLVVSKTKLDQSNKITINKYKFQPKKYLFSEYAFFTAFGEN